MIRDAGLLAHIGERAIAVVVEQPTGLGSINVGNAVVALAVFVIAASLFDFFAEVHETADKKIEAAIVVVVEPDRARGPPGGGDAGFFGHVGESAVAIVVIQNAAAVLRDVQVGEAVTVVIADGHALPYPPPATPAFSVTSVNVPSRLLR